MKRFPLTSHLELRIPRGKDRDRPSWLAKTISEQVHFARDNGGLLYYQSNGVYLPKAESAIGEIAIRILETIKKSKTWTATTNKNVVEYIRSSADILWDKPPGNQLNVTNGILNLDTLALQSHSPEYLSSVQLPIEFDPASICPTWDEFIAEVVPEDCIQTIWEIIAWLITSDVSNHKLVVLLGDGCNGKSTFLRAVTRLLGMSNVSAIPLQMLEENRFAKAGLVGKLANISADLPNRNLLSTSCIKELTSGDRITAERKKCHAFEFEPFAKLVFSANEMPTSSDNTEGFQRRLLIVPFSKRFEENPERGRALDEALATPSELSGALNRALTVLPKVWRTGITVSESMRAQMGQYREGNDPIKVWVDNETEMAPGEWISKKALYLACKEDMQESGEKTVTQQAFGRRLKRLRPQLEECQRSELGVIVWAYLGIRLRNLESEL